MSWWTTAARTWLTGSLSPFLFADENEECLDSRVPGALGLYVHVPFCRRICDFCPYCKELYRPQAAEAYAEALIGEIEMVGQRDAGRVPGQRRAVSSVYVGGGSPALLAGRMGEVMRALGRFYEVRDGVGLELHPSDVRPEVLAQLREAGVTRVSIGVQSFSPRLASLLGRPAPDPRRLEAALREVPVPTVSMDLIFALPGQSVQDVIEDMELAMAHGAHHVAVYPFIDFSFTASRVPAAQHRRKREMMDAIAAYCARHGYERDSIWTFARPGGHRYSSMTRDCYLGFGCSAVTLLRDSFKVNTFSVQGYVERVREGRMPSCLTLRFTRRQRMLYYLFWRAYGMVVSEADFRDFFGVELAEAFGPELWAACRLGLLVHEPGAYRLTRRGAFYFHRFESYYTLSYIDKMWGVLRREAFPQELRI